MIFFLWCLKCTPVPTEDNVLPFATTEERGAWATAHKAATEHDEWLVIEG